MFNDNSRTQAHVSTQRPSKRLYTKKKIATARVLDEKESSNKLKYSRNEHAEYQIVKLGKNYAPFPYM